MKMRWIFSIGIDENENYVMVLSKEDIDNEILRKIQKMIQATIEEQPNRIKEKVN